MSSNFQHTTPPDGPALYGSGPDGVTRYVFEGLLWVKLDAYPLPSAKLWDKQPKCRFCAKPIKEHDPNPCPDCIEVLELTKSGHGGILYHNFPGAGWHPKSWGITKAFCCNGDVYVGPDWNEPEEELPYYWHGKAATKPKQSKKARQAKSTAPSPLAKRPPKQKKSKLQKKLATARPPLGRKNSLNKSCVQTPVSASGCVEGVDQVVQQAKVWVKSGRIQPSIAVYSQLSTYKSLVRGNRLQPGRTRDDYWLFIHQQTLLWVKGGGTSPDGKTHHADFAATLHDEIRFSGV